MKLKWSKGWRRKPHPYWFARRWDTLGTIQVGPIEVFWKRHEN